jgi:hypothetical protein
MWLIALVRSRAQHGSYREQTQPTPKALRRE